jgi:type IV secretion system protein VirB3
VLFGIPLKAAMPVGGTGVVLTFWGGWGLGWQVAIAIAAVTIALLLIMRAITYTDDQALMRLMKALRLKALHRNRGLWGCRSYSAIVYRRRHDAWVR